MGFAVDGEAQNQAILILNDATYSAWQQTHLGICSGLSRCSKIFSST
jgi:hypothetical protein